jgi:hypothetical protein
MRNILSGKWLSDIIGAHDLSDFVMEVQNVSPTSPPPSSGSCGMPEGRWHSHSGGS